MSAAELEKLKKDEEKRRQYREMREAEEEEASKKHRAEERRKREALEKQRAEEERQRILTERQNQWLHDMQKQNEQQRRTQEQTQEQGRRKMEEQEKRKQEEEKARERRKQEEVERKKNKKEEEQRRKRQKKEEKEREKSQKEREKHMKKLEKERRQNWEVTSVNSDSAYRSHDQTPEPHRIGLSRANTVSAVSFLFVQSTFIHFKWAIFRARIWTIHGLPGTIHCLHVQTMDRHYQACIPNPKPKPNPQITRGKTRNPWFVHIHALRITYMQSIAYCYIPWLQIVFFCV